MAIGGCSTYKHHLKRMAPPQEQKGASRLQSGKKHEETAQRIWRDTRPPDENLESLSQRAQQQFGLSRDNPDMQNEGKHSSQQLKARALLFANSAEKMVLESIKCSDQFEKLLDTNPSLALIRAKQALESIPDALIQFKKIQSLAKQLFNLELHPLESMDSATRQKRLIDIIKRTVPDGHQVKEENTTKLFELYLDSPEEAISFLQNHLERFKERVKTIQQMLQLEKELPIAVQLAQKLEGICYDATMLDKKRQGYKKQVEDCEKLRKLWRTKAVSHKLQLAKNFQWLEDKAWREIDSDFNSLIEKRRVLEQSLKTVKALCKWSGELQKAPLPETAAAIEPFCLDWNSINDLPLLNPEDFSKENICKLGKTLHKKSEQLTESSGKLYKMIQQHRNGRAQEIARLQRLANNFAKQGIIAHDVEEQARAELKGLRLSLRQTVSVPELSALYRIEARKSDKQGRLLIHCQKLEENS